jgi:hypothetical protein
MPGFLESLGSDRVVSRVRRWLRPQASGIDWRERALAAERTLLAERANLQLLHQQVAARFAAIAATLAWLHDAVALPPAANDDAYDDGRRGRDE